MKESKILLVDDEEIVLARGRAMLESEGYQVTTAESGEKPSSCWRKTPSI